MPPTVRDEREVVDIQPEVVGAPGHLAPPLRPDEHHAAKPGGNRPRCPPLIGAFQGVDPFVIAQRVSEDVLRDLSAV
jgi:hypothetical protein